MAAKAKFKEAVQQLRDLSLSPDQFPPKVIDIFEAAKAEVTASAAPAKPAGTTPSPSPAPSAAPAKKGGSKTPLILLGVGGAAAAGIGVAAGGGEAKPSPDPRRTEAFTGTLAPEQTRDHEFAVSAAGTADATLTWVDANAFFELELKDRNLTLIGRSSPSAATSARLSAAVSTGQHKIFVFYRRGTERQATYNLTVTRP